MKQKNLNNNYFKRKSLNYSLIVYLIILTSYIIKIPLTYSREEEVDKKDLSIKDQAIAIPLQNRETASDRDQSDFANEENQDENNEGKGGVQKMKRWEYNGYDNY